MTRVNLTQKLLTIDSADRTSGSTSSFDVPIDFPRFNAFNKASVVICEVPKSYYGSGAALTGEIDSTDVFTLATDKFWTATTFAADLETALNASASAVTFTVTYSSVTGKLTIDGDAGFTIETADALLAKYMGIEKDVILTDVVTIVTSTKICNLQRFDTLFVNCSIISNNNSPRLVALFPSGTPDLAFIGYTASDTDLNSVSLTNNGQTSCHIDIVDKNGAAVDLNGLDCRLVLAVWNESV
jgi:hypothetical protein